MMLVGGYLRYAPGVCGVYHDDGIYVACGEALANGDGYCLTRVPGTPAQTKYPALYPAILAVAWYCWPSFPANLILIQAISLFCGWAALACGYLYLVQRCYCTRRVALIASVITATSALYLYYSTTAMSEMPFALVLLAVLWSTEILFDRSLPAVGGAGAKDTDQRPKRERWIYLAVGVLSGLPFLVRSAGIVAVPAVLGVAWYQGRPLRWIVLGAMASITPWIAWSLSQTRSGGAPEVSYYTDYFDCWQSGGVTLMWRVFLTNSIGIGYWTTALTAEGLMAWVHMFWGATWWMLGVVVIGVLTWLRVFRECLRGRLLPTFLILYAGLLLVWSWPPQRFLVPLQLVLAVYVLGVFAEFLYRLHHEPGRFSRGVAATLVTAIVVANGVLLFQHHWAIDRLGYPLISLNDSKVEWKGFEELFAWLEVHSQPADTFATGLDSMVSLYSGRSAIRPYPYRPANLFYGEDPDQWMTSHEFIQRLKAVQPQYLIDTPMPGFAEYPLFRQTLNEVTNRHPEWLQQVYRGKDDRFAVYRLDPRFEPEEPATMH